MSSSIRDELFKLADENYLRFSSSLLPHTENLLGVRLPQLRSIAKRLAQSDWRTYLNEAESLYFEEIMLQGMVIGYAKADIQDILPLIAQFIPKIDNWSVCDSFCSGLKITRTHQEIMWDFLQAYWNAAEEFSVRFAVVMLLHYYIDVEHLSHVFPILDAIDHTGYYVKMAVAWTLSICFVKFPCETMEYFQNHHLDTFTYQKALQKILESHQVDLPTKSLIRKMKQKLTE